MNGQTALHMSQWIERNIPERDRDATIDAMLSFLHDYPDMVETRTWTEIHMLAMRAAEVTR